MARSVNAQEAATSPSIQLPGSECHIVLDGAKFPHPANCSQQALLAAIETWLSVEFDLPIVREHPRLKLVSPAEIAALRFQGLLSNPGTGIAANDHGTSSAEGDTVAVYHDATRSIYLPEGWSGGTPADYPCSFMRWFIIFKMCLASNTSVHKSVRSSLTSRRIVGWACSDTVSRATSRSIHSLFL
jgi:hypothetical protein